jgi:hypothetical protein
MGKDNNDKILGTLCCQISMTSNTTTKTIRFEVIYMEGKQK